MKYSTSPQSWQLATDPIRQFLDAISSAGITPPLAVEPDGKLHRFSSNGKPRDDSGWYCLHADGFAAGSFGDWRAGISETWHADVKRELSPAERAAHQVRVKAMRAAREADARERHAEATERAATIWRTARPAPDDHVYLLHKHVKAHGLRVHGGALVVPMYADGALCSLQFISGDGSKRFLTGGRVAGCYYPIGKPDGVLCIAEGYATGASVHEATGYAVAVAFNAGNLLAVAQSLRTKFPEIRLILCADDDVKTEGNPGLTKAREAAHAAGGLLAVPDFGANRPEGVTDFNDLHKIAGVDTVKRCIDCAASVTSHDANDASGDEAEFQRLAALTPVEYERERSEAAKALRLRESVLDSEVAKRRPKEEKSDGQGSKVSFDTPEAWPEPVAVAELLDEVALTVARFVIMPEECVTACALWLLHAWAHGAACVSPILAITSPEKRCGKTTLLEVLAALSPRALPAANITSAALFRAVEKYSPTLLIDEADTFLRDSDELRGVLNSGHRRRSAVVIRTVGDDFEPRQFCTWAPKAIALIGKLPPTLADRSLTIALRRREPGESIERWRDNSYPELRRKLARFVADNEAVLAEARPDLPADLHDRARDNWEPLLAIADLAGGEWPKRSRQSAKVLSAPDDESTSTMLLEDLQSLFRTRDAPRFTSAEICEHLAALEDRPWPEFGRTQKPITPRQLAGRLTPFGIHPSQGRRGESNWRGYDVSDFADAFTRYLQSPRATPLQPNDGAAYNDFPSATPAEAVADGKTRKPSSGAACSTVARGNPQTGTFGDGNGETGFEV